MEELQFRPLDQMIEESKKKRKEAVVKAMQIANFFKYHGFVNESQNLDSTSLTIETTEQLTSLIKIDMGPYSFESQKIPSLLDSEKAINQGIQIEEAWEIVNCVNLGETPHCVIFKERISKKLVCEIGPKI